MNEQNVSVQAYTVLKWFISTDRKPYRSFYDRFPYVCCHLSGLSDLYNSPVTSCWQPFFFFVSLSRDDFTSNGCHRHDYSFSFLTDHSGDCFSITWLYCRNSGIQTLLPPPSQVSRPILGTDLSIPSILLYSETGSSHMVLAAAGEIW